MQIKNLTPHEIVLFVGEEKITIAPEGIIPRCSVEQQQITEITIDGKKIPIMKTSFGQVENLPEEKEGVFLIVSRAVAEACPDRNDLLIPNDAVRDENGRIIGCRSLARI